MLHLRSEHLEALRPVARAQLPQRIISEAESRGYKARQERDGSVVVAADHRGFESRLEFGNEGLPKTLVKPSGERYGFKYDSNGRLIQQTYPGDRKVVFQRDSKGRVVETRRPSLLAYQFEYDQEGRLQTVRHPDGSEHHSRVSRTEEGNYETALTDRTGATTIYTRTASGQLLAIEDPLGRRTQFERDTDDRLTAIRYPDGTREDFGFEPSLNMGVVSRRDGSRMLVGTDGKGIARAAFWRDGNSTEFETQANGEVTKITNRSGTVIRELGTDGMLTREESLHGTVTRFSYDPDQHLERMEFDSGEMLGFTYDEDGRLASVRDWDGRENRIVYSPNGEISEIRLANGVTEYRDFGQVGRFRSAQVRDPNGRVISSQVYAYDLCERLTGVDDRWGNHANERLVRKFTYDQESRILGEEAVQSRRLLATYKYDVKGNLIEAEGVPLTVGPMDEPTRFGAETIEYDRLGNASRLPGQQGTLHCTYAGDGSLQEVRAGSRRIRFEYDGFGRRVLKSDGEATWRYGWAGHQLLWEEFQQAEDAQPVRRDYLWMPNAVTPLAFRENGSTFWLQADARGAIIRVFDERGGVVWRGIYDSFGNLTVEDGSIRQPWRLAGHYFDQETGLHYNFKRYYSPTIRSYLSRDPKWVHPMAGCYSYCANDPWNRVDPFGDLGFLAIAAIIALAAVAIAAVLGGIDAVRDELDRQAEEGDSLCLSCLVQAYYLGQIKQVGGVFVGAWEGLVDVASGLWGLLEGSFWMGPLGYLISPETSKATWKNFFDTVGFLATNLDKVPGMLWDAMTESIIDDWKNGRYGEAVGRAIFEVADVILGSKGVGKVGKGSRILGNLEDVSDVGRNTRRLEDASDTGGFTGRLRQQEVFLPEVSTQRINYTKRPRAEYDELRNAFNRGVRSDFLQDLASDPAKVQRLREAGLTDADISRMSNGRVPTGWQVHHKIPLDDGGTNDPSNLLLIKNEPSHKVLTNAQRELTGGIEVGETRVVDFPVPDGFIYPPRIGMVDSP